jgi:hypothetical protein
MGNQAENTNVSAAYRTFMRAFARIQSDGWARWKAKKQKKEQGACSEAVPAPDVALEHGTLIKKGSKERRRNKRRGRSHEPMQKTRTQKEMTRSLQKILCRGRYRSSLV